MPWTKTNYPDSMKKLTVRVRNKAIEIANAILKEDKKMNEGVLIATAIKRAKDMQTKNGQKIKSAVKKKTKSAGEKEVKSAAKSKTKIVLTKKVTSPSKKVKVTAEKKIKSPAKTKLKISAEKKMKSPAKTLAKSSVKKETKKPGNGKAEKPVIEASIPETIIHGEDLHLIYKQGEAHPITPSEVHQFENIFQHKEEIAIRQENKKAQEGLPSRKNAKRFHHFSGRR